MSKPISNLWRVDDLFILTNYCSYYLSLYIQGIDSQSGSLPSTRAKFLAEIVRNSNIITARSNPIMTATATTTTTTTTTAKTTKTPAPMPALPTSTAAAPKTTANPAAGVLDDFSFLNVLVCVFFKYQLQVCLITKI
jgi:hypothetical protein